MSNTVYVAMGIQTTTSGPQQPSVRYFENRNEAERQFHLYCAAAATSYDIPVYTAMLMTTEGFVLEQKAWKHDVQPEPTPEPTPEPEPDLEESVGE